MPITRITQNVIMETTRNILQRQQRTLLEAQEIVATQKRINRISDDPVGAGQVMDLGIHLSQSNQFIRNIDRAVMLADAYDTSLNQANELLTRARELILSQANTAVTSPQTREAVAIELIALREQMLNIANTKVGNQHIYSGHETSLRPFEGVNVIAIPALSNAGTGTLNSMGISNVVDVDGDSYDIQFTSATEYSIVNTTSGLTVSSGNAYTPGEDITIAGITVRISGAPVAGDLFSLGTTVAGTYVGDSGQIRLEIEQDVFSNVSLAGNAVFQGVGVAGGEDIFAIFSDAIQALRDNDEPIVVGTLDRLDNAQDQIVNHQAIVGARQNLFDSTQERLQDLTLNLETLISSIEDVDVTEAITNFTVAENAYQASLGAASRMIQPSLMDFLR